MVIIPLLGLFNFPQSDHSFRVVASSLHSRFQDTIDPGAVPGVALVTSLNASAPSLNGTSLNGTTVPSSSTASAAIAHGDYFFGLSDQLQTRFSD